MSDRVQRFLETVWARTPHGEAPFFWVSAALSRLRARRLHEDFHTSRALRACGVTEDNMAEWIEELEFATALLQESD